MTDLSTDIATAAARPKQVSVDGTSVVGQDVDSLIKADQYLAAKAGVVRNSPSFGLRFAKLKPPGGGL